MSDSDDQFLEALARELAPLLGPRLDLLGLDLERPRDGWVEIIATVDTTAGVERIMEEGDSLTSVAAALLERATVYRLAHGFREVTDPGSIHGWTASSR